MYEFVGAGLKPARYGNRLAMPDVRANNDLARTGFKPAPTEKCPNFRTQAQVWEHTWV
jgi:hypothetical protein